MCSGNVEALYTLAWFWDCPGCGHVVGEEAPGVHFMSAHTNLSISLDDCVFDALIEDVFVHGRSLHKIFRAPGVTDHVCINCSCSILYECSSRYGMLSSLFFLLSCRVHCIYTLTIHNTCLHSKAAKATSGVPSFK